MLHTEAGALSSKSVLLHNFLMMEILNFHAHSKSTTGESSGYSIKDS